MVQKSDFIFESHILEVFLLPWTGIILLGVHVFGDTFLLGLCKSQILCQREDRETGY